MGSTTRARTMVPGGRMQGRTLHPSSKQTCRCRRCKLVPHIRNQPRTNVDCVRLIGGLSSVSSSTPSSRLCFRKASSGGRRYTPSFGHRSHIGSLAPTIFHSFTKTHVRDLGCFFCSLPLCKEVIEYLGNKSPSAC